MCLCLTSTRISNFELGCLGNTINETKSTNHLDLIFIAFCILVSTSVLARGIGNKFGTKIWIRGQVNVSPTAVSSTCRRWHTAKKRMLCWNVSPFVLRGSLSSIWYGFLLIGPKVLMDEQKMSIIQRGRIENYLKNGAPLPKPTPLHMNTTKCRPNVDFLRARTAKRRTLAAIKASGVLDYDKWVFSPIICNCIPYFETLSFRYHPKPTSRATCDQQKLRLQAKMSGIEEIDEADFDPKMMKKANEPNETDEIDPIDECN